MTRLIRAMSVFSLALLSGCVPLACPTCTTSPAVPSTTAATPPVPVQVAHVSAIYNGSAAFVGSTAARVNEPIYLGDHFYTGAGTMMEVTLESGGTVMLDENTDPGFFQTAKCFIIRLLSGRMTVTNTQPLCVENGPNVAGQHSYVLYEAHSGSLRITVFQGQVTTLSPSGFTINAGQSMILQNGRAVGPPRQLSPAILNRMQSWIPRVIF